MNSEFVAFAIFLMTFSYSSEAACKDSGQNCVNMLHLCHNHVYQSIMSSYCPASCGHCIGKCVDKAKNCYTWSSMGFCSPYYFSIYRMNFYCTKSCGLCKTKQRKSKKPKKQAEKSAQKPKPPPKSAPEKSKLYREDSKTTAAKLAGQPTTKTTATKAATTKRTTTANYKRQNSDATSNSPTIVPAATSTPPESTSVAFTSKNGVAGTRLLSVASSTTEGIRTSSGASEKLGGRTIAVGTKTMKSVTKVWKIPTSPAAADVPSTREKSRSIIKTTTRRRPLITTQNGISTSSRAAKKFGGSTINAVRTIVIKPMTKAWKIPTSPPAADAPTTREKSRSIIKTTTRRRPQATTQNGASSSTTEIISTSSGGSNNKEFGDSTVNAVGTTTVKPTPPESPSVPSTNENSFDRTTLSIVVSTTEGTSTSSRAAETFGGSTVNAVETTAIKPTLPERTFVASTSENVVDSSRLLSIASSTSEVISTSSRAAKKLGRSTINAVGRKTMKSVTKAWKMPTSPAAADVPITKETPRSIVKTTTGRTPQATAQNRASSTATVSSVTSLFEGTPSLVNDIEATKATTTWLPFGSSSTIGAAMTQTTDREGTSVTPSATTENIPTATGPIQNPTSRDSQLDKSTVLASSATSGPATPATSTSTLLLTSHLSTNVANTGTTRLPSTSIGLSTVAIDGSEATTNSEGTATTIRDEKSSTESQTITTKGFKTRVINLAETTLTDLQTSPTTKVLTTGMASTASTKDIGPVSQPLTATTIVNPAQSTPQALVYESTTTNRDVITDLTDASFATVTVFTTSTSSAAFTTAGQTLAQSASTKEETAEITSTSSNKETSTSSPSSGMLPTTSSTPNTPLTTAGRSLALSTSTREGTTEVLFTSSDKETSTSNKETNTPSSTILPETASTPNTPLTLTTSSQSLAPSAFFREGTTEVTSTSLNKKTSTLLPLSGMSPKTSSTPNTLLTTLSQTLALSTSTKEGTTEASLTSSNKTTSTSSPSSSILSEIASTPVSALALTSPSTLQADMPSSSSLSTEGPFTMPSTVPTTTASTNRPSTRP